LCQRGPLSNYLGIGIITYRVERVLRVYAKHDDDTLTVAIVIFSDGFVLVLTSSVPYLQFDAGALLADNFVDVIDADGHHVVLYELAFGVSEQHIRLAYP
jgi:hypothetical protein